MLGESVLRPIGLNICRAGIGALGLLSGLAPSLVMAQDATNSITIRVHHILDKKIPIKSVIGFFSPHEVDKFVRIGETDENGELEVRQCAQGVQIQARPNDDRTYHYSRRVFCNGPIIKLRIQSATIVSTLQTNYDQAKRAEQWAIAATAANELSWVNLRDGEGVAGPEAERLTYVNAGKALGVVDSVLFDPEQGRNVIAPPLKDAISKFQRERGIPVREHGILDNITLYEMSGTNSDALRKLSFYTDNAAQAVD